MSELSQNSTSNRDFNIFKLLKSYMHMLEDKLMTDPENVFGGVNYYIPKALTLT